jgi:hypothetical protein
LTARSVKAVDTFSPVLPELSDKHQTVGEVSLNPPARESRGLGKAGQLPARETFEDGTTEVPADEPLPGKAREHPDGEIREPVPLGQGWVGVAWAPTVWTLSTR